jgi:hypothetical protein
MSISTRRIKVGLSVAALGALAAGCSGGNNSKSSPVTSVTAQEDSFGTVFGTAFRADPDSSPIIPKDGDIIPLSLDTDPKPIK